MRVNRKRQKKVPQERTDQLLEAFLERAIDPKFSEGDLNKTAHQNAWNATMAGLVSGHVKPDHLMNRVHVFIPKRPVALYCCALLWNEARDTATYYFTADSEGATPFVIGRGRQYNQQRTLKFNQILQSAVDKRRPREQEDTAAAADKRVSATRYDPSLPLLKQVERDGMEVLELTENARTYWDDRPAAPKVTKVAKPRPSKTPKKPEQHN